MTSGLTWNLVEDVRLVSSELATNAARHARTSFTVLLEGLVDSVRLTVTHDCVPRPVMSAVPVMATAGRGLNIVGADLVEVAPAYDTSGNTALLAANLLYEMLCVLPGVAHR